MAKKKPTKLQAEYKRVRRNLQNKISRYKKQDIFLKEDIPAIPKKITKKAIKALEDISKNFLKKAEYIDFETGEVIEASDKKAIKQHKKEITDYIKIPSEADMVIANYLALLKQAFPSLAYPILSSLVNKLIDKRGKESVAQMLQDSAQEGVIVNYKVAYSKDKMLNYVSETLDFLPDIGQIEKEDILESLEGDEEWTHLY